MFLIESFTAIIRGFEVDSDSLISVHPMAARNVDSFPSLTVVRQRNKADDDSETPFLGKRSSTSATTAYQVYRRHSSAQFYGETDSHQYEQDESEVWKHHQLQRFIDTWETIDEFNNNASFVIIYTRHFEDKGHWWTFAKKREVRRWFLTLMTGFFCGVVALFVTFFTKLITKFKFRVFYELLERSVRLYRNEKRV